MAISLVQRILGKTPCAGVHRSKGFTLIELLVVLAILTMLAGLVGPKVLNQLGGAKSKTASVQIATMTARPLKVVRLACAFATAAATSHRNGR